MREFFVPPESEIDILGRSSKGDQPKWYANGIWYKADHMGYEGLSEVVVSRLLHKTNIQNFVDYEPIKIEFDNHRRSGCLSKDFMKKGNELIPLQRLFRSEFGFYGLSDKLMELPDAKERILFTAQYVANRTGLVGFGEYLTAMLEMDALFLNTDRHVMNIAIINDPKRERFELCPYFDFGLSLLADLQFFWLAGDVNKHILRASGKPFGTFRSQVEAAEELYGNQFRYWFTMEDVDEVLDDLEEYYADDILKRVRYVLEQQMAKYDSWKR